MQAKAIGSFFLKVILLMNLCAFGGCQPGAAPVRRLLVPAG